MKVALLAVALVIAPLVSVGTTILTRPEPQPFVFQEDDPGWCVGRPFPCGVWPVGTPNHEGVIVIDSAPAYAHIP